MPHARSVASAGLAGRPADPEDDLDDCRSPSFVVTRRNHGSARPRGPRLSRLLLAGAALVLGIGSCQLPKPALPKLQADAADNVRVGSVAIDPGVARRSGG